MKVAPIMLFALAALVALSFAAESKEVKIQNNQDLIIFKYLFSRHSILPRLSAEVAVPKEGESFATPTKYKVYSAYEYPRDLPKLLKLDEGSGDYNIDGAASYGGSVAFGFTWFPLLCILFYIFWILTFFCCCCCCKCGSCCCCGTKTFKMPQAKEGERSDEVSKRKAKIAKMTKKLTKKRRNTSVCMNLVTCCLCAGSAMLFMAVLALVGIASDSVLGRVDEVNYLVDRYMGEIENSSDLPKKLAGFVSTASKNESYQDVIDRLADMTADEKLVLSSVMGTRSEIYKACKAATFDSDCCIPESDFSLFFPLDAIRSMAEKDVPPAEKVEMTDLVSFMIASTTDISDKAVAQLNKMKSATCAVPGVKAVLSKPVFSSFDSTIVKRLDSALKAVGISDIISGIIDGLSTVFAAFDNEFSGLTSNISTTLTNIIGAIDDVNTLNTAVDNLKNNSADGKTGLVLLDFIGGGSSAGALNGVLSLPDQLGSLTDTITDLETDMDMSLSDMVDFIPDDFTFAGTLQSTSDKFSVLMLNTLFMEYSPFASMISENLEKAEKAIMDIDVTSLPDSVGEKIYNTTKVEWDYVEPKFVDFNDGKYTEVEAKIHNVMLVVKSVMDSISENIYKYLGKAMWDAGLSSAPPAIYSGIEKFGKFATVMRPANKPRPLSLQAEEEWEVVDAVATTKKGGLAVSFVLSLIFSFSCICTCCAGFKRSRCCSCCAVSIFTITFLIAWMFAFGMAALNDVMIEGCNAVDGILNDPQTVINTFLGDDMRPASDSDFIDIYRKARGELPFTTQSLNAYGVSADINVEIDVKNDLQLNNLFNSFNDPKNLLVSLSLVNTLNTVVDNIYSQLSNSNFVKDVVTNLLAEQMGSIKQSFIDSTSSFYGPGSTIETMKDQFGSYLNDPALTSLTDSLDDFADPALLNGLTNLEGTVLGILNSLTFPGLGLPTTAGGKPTAEGICGFQSGGSYYSDFSGRPDADIKTYLETQFFDVAKYPGVAPNPIGDDAAYCALFYFVGSTDADSLADIPPKTIKAAIDGSGADKDFALAMFYSMLALDMSDAGPKNFNTWCTDPANSGVCSAADIAAAVGGATGVALATPTVANIRTALGDIFTGADEAAYATLNDVKLPQTLMSLSATLKALESANTPLTNLRSATSGLVGSLPNTLNSMTTMMGDINKINQTTFTTIANKFDTASSSINNTLVTASGDMVDGLVTTFSDILGSDLNLLRTDITSYLKDVMIAPVCGAGGSHPGFMAFIGYFSLAFTFILVGTCCGICASCRGLRYFRVFPQEEEKRARGKDHHHHHDSHDDSDSQTQYDSVYSSEVSYETYSDYSSESPRGHHGHRHGGHHVGGSNVRPLNAGMDDMNAFYINT